MIDHTPYYYVLNTESTISDELLDYCKSMDKWSRPGWATFLQIPPPRDIIEKDPLINSLHEQGWIPQILKSEPRSIYQFHTDRANRPAALNMLLGDSDSVTLFRGNLIYRNQYELIKVDYKPKRYYLLNTTQLHAVFNYGTDRYVLSLSPPKKYIDPLWNFETPELSPITDETRKIYSTIVDEFKKQNY